MILEFKGDEISKGIVTEPLNGLGYAGMRAYSEGSRLSDSSLWR